MAAKDKYHFQFKEALEKDGWSITHDPYILEVGETEYEIDIGAEKLIGAERNGQKIAVEIKSFLSESLAYDFHEALGQYLEYRIGLDLQEPDRQVYLAISASRYDRIKKLMLPRLAMEQFQVSLVTFDVISKTIVQWIKK